MTDSADNEAIRAERDALLAEVEELKSQHPMQRRSRRRFATVFVVLASIAFMVSTFGFWANRNFLRTDIWVKRVAPLAQDAAVQQSIANQMTAQLILVIKPEQLFENVLPEKGKLLAAPLAGAVNDFIGKESLKLVQTKQFQTLWVELNRTAHEKAVEVLKGNSRIVQSGQNSVVINFIPLINEVLADLSAQTPELFGKQVTLPKITYSSIPADARKEIADALGVTLPPNFGVIRVYDRGALKNAQSALKIFNKVLVISTILSVLFVIAAFAITNRRRRTSLQLLAGLSLALVVVRRVVLYLDKVASDQIKNPQDKTSVSHIIHAFIDPLLASTEKVLIGFALIAAALILTANYDWVVSLRKNVAALSRHAFAAAQKQATDDATTEWIAKNHQALEIGIGGVFVVALWVISFSWIGLLVCAVLFGGAGLIVRRIANSHQVANVWNS